MTIAELHKKTKRIDLRKIGAKILKKLESRIIELQQDQLYAGQTSEGGEIKPSYSQEWYADWKQKITPSSKRSKDTPNLYVTGDFYDSLYGTLRDDNFEIDTNSSKGKDLIQKYKKVLGLNEKGMELIIFEFYELFMIELRKRIGI